MTRLQMQIVWSLAALLVLSAGWRARALPDLSREGAAVGAIEDRREHHFRNLTYSQTQRLFERLLQAAERAPDSATRARDLARIAALQHERGLIEAAEAAAGEALRFAPDDPQVRRLLSTRLDLDALEREP